MNVTIPDKYFNPFTDFGFKKLFGTEVNKDLLMDLKRLQERIFEKAFKVAEIAKMTLEQVRELINKLEQN